MTDAGKSWHKLSSASDQFRKALLSYWVLVLRWSTSAKVPKKCMKRWLTLGNVRLRWPPSAKVSKRWRTFDPKRSRCEPKFWAREREFHRRFDDFSEHFKVGATFAQTFPMWIYLWISGMIIHVVQYVQTLNSLWMGFIPYWITEIWFEKYSGGQILLSLK